jgi:hypothetical protein
MVRSRTRGGGTLALVSTHANIQRRTASVWPRERGGRQSTIGRSR